MGREARNGGETKEPSGAEETAWVWLLSGLRGVRSGAVGTERAEENEGKEERGCGVRRG